MPQQQKQNKCELHPSSPRAIDGNVMRSTWNGGPHQNANLFANILCLCVCVQINSILPHRQFRSTFDGYNLDIAFFRLDWINICVSNVAQRMALCNTRTACGSACLFKSFA